MFGDTIMHLGYEDAVDAGNVVPINVYVVPVSGPAITSAPNGKPFFALTADVEFERWNIWRNRIRNEKIAQVARQLQAKGSKKILCIVSKLEHAYYLKQQMPEFEVVHGGLDEARAKELRKQGVLPEGEVLKPNTKQQYARFKSGELQWVIATWKWKEGIDVVDLQHVIRCDASPGAIPCIQIGGRASRLCAGKTEGIVIDFSDNFGPRMEARAKKRWKVYRDTGWPVLEWELQHNDRQ
jgi:superfamily II DNA or RNA helicase